MLFLTIKKRHDFLRIGKENLRFHSKTTLILASKTPKQYLNNPRTKKVVDVCRIGYTVSKMVGNSVIRNRVKRRYRAAFKELFTNYALNHYDYILIAKKEVATAEYKKLYDDLKFCLKGITKLLNKDESNKHGSATQ